MSYTIWVYDHDAAPHHDNNLGEDTFDDINKAVRQARTLVEKTNHNTGWAKIIDNRAAGHMGDNGVVVRISKSAYGHARMTYRREGLELGPCEHLQYCRENRINPFEGGHYIPASTFKAYAKKIEQDLLNRNGKAPTWVTVLNHSNALVADEMRVHSGHRIKVPDTWRRQMRNIALSI